MANLSPDKQEGEKITPVRIFKNAQEAIDAVQKDHAVAIYEDTYMDQINPNYIVFYDQKRYKDFEKTLTNLRNEPGGTEKKRQLFERLDELAGSDVESNDLRWIYRSEWAVTPEELLQDEDSSRMQQEDDDFFQHQREHFSPENEEQRQLAREEEDARKKQIRLESDEEELGPDGRPLQPSDNDVDDDRPRGMVVGGDEDEEEPPWDEDLSIRDPNPPIELGTSRSKIEKGSDNQPKGF